MSDSTNNFSFVIEGVLAGMALPGFLAPLEQDLAELSRQGVSGIVSLTASPLDERRVAELGFEYLHLPIRDLAPPSLEDVARFLDFLRLQVDAGRAVAVHCRIGQGRTGTMLACALACGSCARDPSTQKLRKIS